MEPVQIPIERIFPARALTHIEPSARQSSQAMLQASPNAIRRADRAYVVLATFSGETLIVPKATVLGIAEEVSEDLVNRVNAESVSNTNSPARPPSKRKKEHFYSHLLQGKLDHLRPEERRHLEPVLMIYAHVFHEESTNYFKGSKVTEHHILVGDASPIRKPHTKRLSP